MNDADTKLHRLDPPDCGCTDCILRDWSIPVDTADDDQVLAMLAGDLMNATAYPADAYLVIRDGAGAYQAIIMPWKRDAFDDALRSLA